MTIDDLIRKSRDAEPFTRDEIVAMLSVPPDSADAYRLLAEGRRVSEEVTDGKAEIHGQFALNLAPCACNCLWCSFAKTNGIFQQEWRMEPAEAQRWALAFEEQGANAVLMMTTTEYPFSLFLDMVREVRGVLRPETILIGNVGDKTSRQAQQLRDAGLDGVYHARRFREGIDNGIDPDIRLKSIRSFQEAGLSVGTCVEPIGPEHGNDEIAELIEFTAALRPAFSGAARRIPIPGTAMAERGIISELRMAQCVAVTRICMPRATRGNCTHEPCTLGALGGATLFWAEVGANPRDDQEKTEENRGQSVAACCELYREAGWDVLTGVSEHFRRAPEPAMETR